MCVSSTCTSNWRLTKEELQKKKNKGREWAKQISTEKKIKKKNRKK